MVPISNNYCNKHYVRVYFYLEVKEEITATEISRWNLNVNVCMYFSFTSKAVVDKMMSFGRLISSTQK